MDNLLNKKTDSLKGTASATSDKMENSAEKKADCLNHRASGTASAVTPERNQKGFEDDGSVIKLKESPTEVSSVIPATKNESSLEFVQNEKYFVYLAMQRTNPFRSIVGIGKGKKVKDVVDSRYSLIAFIVGAANNDEAVDLQKRWESDLVIVETLEEQVLEGQGLCVLLAYKYPNLKIVVDWENVERKQALRTPITNFPGSAMVQSTQTVNDHPNNGDTYNNTSTNTKNLETLGNLVMPFGKHIGKSYRTIVNVFPGYVDWARSLTSPDAVLERLIRYADWQLYGFVGTKNIEKSCNFEQGSALQSSGEKPPKEETYGRRYPNSTTSTISEIIELNKNCTLDDCNASLEDAVFDRDADTIIQCMNVKKLAETNEIHSSTQQKLCHGGDTNDVHSPTEKLWHGGSLQLSDKPEVDRTIQSVSLEHLVHTNEVHSPTQSKGYGGLFQLPEKRKVNTAVFTLKTDNGNDKGSKQPEILCQSRTCEKRDGEELDDNWMKKGYGGLFQLPEKRKVNTAVFTLKTDNGNDKGSKQPEILCQSRTCEKRDGEELDDNCMKKPKLIKSNGNQMSMIEDDVVEIVGVKPPCIVFPSRKKGSKSPHIPFDDFSYCLGLVSDPHQILASQNPGLELALRGNFTGPVVIQNRFQQNQIVSENSRRCLLKSKPVVWYCQNVFHELKATSKHSSFEPLAKLNILMEAVSPGPATVEFGKMFPPLIKGGSDVPVEVLKMKEDGKLKLVEVVHREKIKELSDLVKFCKDPWSSSLQKQLLQVQREMESAEYEAVEGVHNSVLDLAVIAQNEGFMGKLGASLHGRNVRLAWCNVMNSFLRKDQFMFTLCLQVLMYHLESAK